VDQFLNSSLIQAGGREAHFNEPCLLSSAKLKYLSSATDKIKIAVNLGITRRLVGAQNGKCLKHYKERTDL